jgi:hypothetical protein
MRTLIPQRRQMDAVPPIGKLSFYFSCSTTRDGAHAETVVGIPGEMTGRQIYWASLALNMSYSGIGTAVQTISRGLLGSANPLKRALYAGALCEVCRHADEYYAFTPSERLIHGSSPFTHGWLSLQDCGRQYRFQ